MIVRKHTIHAPHLDVPPPLPPPIEGAAAPAAARAAAAARPAYDGASIWARWHRRALSWSGGDDRAWILREVLARVPCGDCRRHLREYLLATAPDFTAAGYFAWTVAFHNAVNRRLGKPVLDIDAARAWWSASPVL